MFGDVRLAPSLLSANFLNLEADLRLIERARPEFLHVDVMDGHFVPNLTIGPPIVRALKGATDLPLDVHLMISNPAEQLDWFLEAGADLITLHVESESGHTANAGSPAARAGSSSAIERVEDPATLLALIERVHAAGALAGISLNPNTAPEALRPFLEAIDLVLVMSVHPGFGGQSFIEATLERLTRIVELAREAGVDPLLEVDGGIDERTAGPVVARGADVLVAGSAIFGAPDPRAALQAIRAAARAQQERMRG